jgi:hypothetical protein
LFLCFFSNCIIWNSIWFLKGDYLLGICIWCLIYFICAFMNVNPNVSADNHTIRWKPHCFHWVASVNRGHRDFHHWLVLFFWISPLF